jgi:hypothetical protein
MSSPPQQNHYQDSIRANEKTKSGTALGFIKACESRLRARVVPEIRNPTVSTQVGGCRLLKMNFLTA